MNRISSKKKGPKVSHVHRTKRVMTVRKHGFTYYAFVFIIPIMIIFNCASAFSLDFITQEDFVADEASYKDYPLRLLFKKLAESDPSEKAVIRNYIILKQVFDQNTKKMDKTGIIKFEESYGTIKEITEDNLKLWVPETNNYRNYFLGLEKIPTEKAGKYRVTESNITDYACVIYSLDARVYKIKIDFKIAPPDQLNVERDGSSNIVSWSEPSGDKKPYMYKLFRNGELFETVEENSAEVPREKRIIDNYFVKSVYKHGQGILESDASEVLYDEITAKERQNELTASEFYAKIESALMGKEYGTAKGILYDEKDLLYTYLNDEKKEEAKSLTTFFTYIDEGDRIIAEKPDNLNSLETAINAYDKAKLSAEPLPENLNTTILAQSKIDKSLEKKRLLEDRNNEMLANEIYNSIITAINLEDYEKAKKILYDNSSFLDEFLNQSKKSNIRLLMEIFHDIDEGDKLGLEEPETTQRLGMALSHYQKAGKTATQLSPDIDINSIIQLKIKAGEDRLAMLDRQDKVLIAQETYNEIIESMKPLEWENGEKILKDNIKSLSQYLPQDKKEVIDSLMAFFNELEKGDSLRREMPETKEKLDKALALYSDAGDIADGFSYIVNVRFISDQKIRDGLDRKSHLEMINKRTLAREKYEEIIASMNREHWEEGKNLLFENRQLMQEYLDDYLTENTERLVEFFQDVEEGDRLSETLPATVESLENAFSLYKRAEQKASDLPNEIDILFLTNERIDECRNKINRIEEETRKKEVLAAAREKETAVQKEEEDSGVKILTTTIPPVDESDRESILKSAMEKFDKNDYTASWNDFQRVYRKQINNIIRGGQYRIKGVLGLPTRYRAEIFFLIELENLRNEGEEITEEGLEEINDRVENGEGMWTIIRDTGKIRKIRRHIARFDLEKSE